MLTITGHAGLAGNTSGDENNLSALEGVGETGGGGIVASDLFNTSAHCSYQGPECICRTSLLVLMWPMSAATPVQHYLASAQCSMDWQRQLKHTGSKADIVEGELANPGVELQQQRQWLANATSGTENGNL